MADIPAGFDNSVRIGYARVSTRAQDHQAQLDALAAAHCRNIIVETASIRDGRPKLLPAPELQGRERTQLVARPGLWRLLPRQVIGARRHR